MNNPKCFISYSWDDKDHKDWVRRLSTELQLKGVETFLDLWDVYPGMDLLNYMGFSIKRSDFVLIICTPLYAKKADERSGGAGYENIIISGEIFRNAPADKKFIPLLRNGNPAESLPSYLKSRVFIDFRNDNNFSHSLEELLRHIHQSPKYIRPPLGTKPTFGSLDLVRSSDDSLILITAIVNAFDAQSVWFNGHSERVATYAKNIARQMGFNENEIKNLSLAGLLHDIGKIATYQIITDKPDRLTKEEFELVKLHPTFGAKKMDGLKQYADLAFIIKCHHERIDGKGYPSGLEGAEIPLYSKIITVADSFDAMTTDRPYRPVPGKDYAISELKRCSGTQFDSQVVDSFLESLDESQE